MPIIDLFIIIVVSVLLKQKPGMPKYLYFAYMSNLVFRKKKKKNHL
jgi:hypothetical protein